MPFPVEIISSPKTLNAILESSFVQNILFQGAPYSTEFNPKFPKGNIVVYLELYDIDIQLIDKIKSTGNKVILYHMGDELANKDIAAYAQCDLIIRNYFFQTIFNDSRFANKILWAPNGYKTGVGPRALGALKIADNRKYLSCFLGWLSNSASFNGERSLFSEAVAVWVKTKKHRAKNLRQWFNHYLSLSKEYFLFSKVASACTSDLYLLRSNGFSSGYNVGLYSATMENSIFAPCPAGNAAETIRLYDALECGCIPVSLHHEFISSQQALGSLGTPPFYFLESWDQFPIFLSQMKEILHTNPEVIQKMQADCTAWWSNYKKYITQTIADRIEGLN